MYCENCFAEKLKNYVEDRLGSIFCNRKCYLESAEFREIPIKKTDPLYNYIDGIFKRDI